MIIIKHSSQGKKSEGMKMVSFEANNGNNKIMNNHNNKRKKNVTKIAKTEQPTKQQTKNTLNKSELNQTNKNLTKSQTL